MSMEGIRFSEQLSFRPELSGGEAPSYSRIVVCGVGGSGFPVRALSYLDPSIDVMLHSDYGAPRHVTGDVLYVAISYSGNTGETLSFAEEVLEHNYPLAVVTSGGKLLEIAREKDLPHVVVPEGIQPRDALLYLLRGLLTVAENDSLLDALQKVPIDTKALEGAGAKVAEEFRDKIPVIYSSRENKALSYLWKTLANESAKVPAFSNVFPELTHNEIQGLFPEGPAKLLREKMRVLLLRSEEDDERIKNQMHSFVRLAKGEGLEVTEVNLLAKKEERLMQAWIMARGFAHALAAHYGADPHAVPAIENFKKGL